MDECFTLTNGRIVLPGEVLERGSVSIRDGRIVHIGPTPAVCATRFDLDGAWLFPGFIDLHSDAIEMEIQPRPNCTLPMGIAIREIERKLISAGVTTIYHALSLSHAPKARQTRNTGVIERLAETLLEYRRSEQGLIRHRIHLRFEISNTAALASVHRMLDNRAVELLSFMDHTPGQGQFHSIEHYRSYLQEHHGFDAAAVSRYLTEIQERDKTAYDSLTILAQRARRQGIPLASHDDDSCDKLDLIAQWRGVISEFPISLPVAKRARELGLSVIVGAPNLINGGSTGGNLSAVEAIQQGAANILCSDYYPPALMHAVFYLYRLGYPMQDAVRLVTLQPAQTMGVDDAIGSIAIGREADLLAVHDRGDVPHLEQVWVQGRRVSLVPVMRHSSAVGGETPGSRGKSRRQPL